MQELCKDGTTVKFDFALGLSTPATAVTGMAAFVQVLNDSMIATASARTIRTSKWQGRRSLVLCATGSERTL